MINETVSLFLKVVKQFKDCCLVCISKQGQQIKVPTVKDIQLWLMEKMAYTAHRPLHKKYPMKKVIVGSVNIQLQMDAVFCRLAIYRNLCF